MNIDTSRYTRTRDGDEFRLIASDLGGELPVAILVDGEIYRLDRNLECPDFPGMSLAEARREHVRYFNIYRAADGGFVFGSKAFASDSQRRGTNDSRRAIAGVRVVLNDATGSVTAEAV